MLRLLRATLNSWNGLRAAARSEQAFREEVVALLIPTTDARTADIERTSLWTEINGRRLDPLELLGVRT